MIQILKNALVKAALVGAIGLAAPAAITGAAFACGDDTAAPSKAVPADAAKVTFAVDGMSCGSCATSVHNALMAVDGVFDATVDFDKGTAIVAYDAKKVKTDALSAAIVKAGFKAAQKS